MADADVADPVLTLKLAGDNANLFVQDDFYELKLKECLSGPSSATAWLYTLNTVDSSKLSALVGTTAGISFSATTESGKSSRSFKGVVESCTYEGLVGSVSDLGAKKECHCYRLKVVAPLELLRRRAHLRTFYGLTPLKVINEILKPLTDKGLLKEPVIDGKLLDQRYFDEAQIFAQTGQSDYAFLLQLLKFYGINYSYGYDGDELAPVLYLSRGGVFFTGCGPKMTKGEEGSFDSQNLTSDAQAFLCCQNTNSLSDAQTHVSGGKSKVVTQDFFKKQVLMVSKLRTKAPPAAVPPLQTYAFASCGAFESYGRRAEALRLSQNLQARADSLSRLTLKGSSTELSFIPGRLFELYDGPAAGSLVVLSSTCTLRRYKTTDERTVDLRSRGPRLEVKFKALLPGDAVNLGCLAPEDETLSITPALAVEAEVCDDKGQTQALAQLKPFSSDPRESPRRFYARTDSGEVLVAEFTCRQGGHEDLPAQGEFPRVGERVLLRGESGRFYLNARLPKPEHKLSAALLGETATAVAGAELGHSLLALRRIITREKDHQCAGLEVSTYDNSAEAQLQLAISALQRKQLAVIKERQKHAINKRSLEPALEDKYPEVTTALEKVTLSRRDLVTALEDLCTRKYEVFSRSFSDGINYHAPDQSEENAAQAKYKQAGSNYESALKSLSDAAAKFRQKLKLDQSDAKQGEEVTKEILLTLSSDGGVMISAPQGKISLQATNLDFTASKGISFYAPEVKVCADSSVKFTADTASLSMDEDAVSLVSRRWSNLSTITGSSLSVAALKGITMSGQNINAKSVFGASMSDAMGGSLATSLGHVICGGTHVDVRTNSGLTNALNLVQFGYQEALVGADLIHKQGFDDESSEAKDTVKAVYDFMPNPFNVLKAIEKYQKAKKDGKLNVATVVTLVLNIVAEAINTAINVLGTVKRNTTDPDKKKALSESITWTTVGLDAVKLSSMISTESAYLAANLIPTNASTMSVEASKVVLKSTKFDTGTAELSFAQGPVPALAQNMENNQNNEDVDLEQDLEQNEFYLEGL
ncbi:MAG: hypothetical protein IJ228_06835 [Succinivibrio sp.]|nr:hypothetical protein [Succinivibrio sp.]